MSAYPSHTQMAKRALEDPSSPSAPKYQPDAKRPAFGKLVKTDAKAETNVNSQVLTVDSKDNQGDTVVTDAPNGKTYDGTEPNRSTTSHGDRAGSQFDLHVPQDESSWIHIRAVMSSPEAATVIGKGGENVSQIRRISGAKCSVSDYARGVVERILTVRGPQESVAKAFGLIIRTLNNETLDAPSTAQFKRHPLRLLIPHILIGSIMGKGGSRIKEIQEASGARLNASDACLPLSTERYLVILGVADAVHIATYYVALTLIEHLTERSSGPAASACSTRSGGPAGAVPDGMRVVPYVPQSAGGQYGYPESFSKRGPHSKRAQAGAYGVPYMNCQPAPAPHQAGAYVPGPQPTFACDGHPTHTPVGSAMPGQHSTQQIYILNDMVGAIIGKGGAKIDEIRHLSGSKIKINELQEHSNERLVTITGTQESNQMAICMLYSRLESEKHRV